MSFELQTKAFQQAVREHLATTKRELADATNARMFYLFLRVFALLPPKDPKMERQKIRAYMTQEIVEMRVSQKPLSQFALFAALMSHDRTSKPLRRVDLISQARRKRSGKGVLLPRQRRELEAHGAGLLNRAVGSVGYTKSAVVKSLKALSGGFAQFGIKRGKRSTKKDVPPNQALLKIASEYGMAYNNVGVHKGAKQRTKGATPGISPVATVNLSIGLADGQVGKVTSEYNAAMSRAMADEMAEMKRHIAERMQAVADKHNAK